MKKLIKFFVIIFLSLFELNVSANSYVDITAEMSTYCSNTRHHYGYAAIVNESDKVIELWCKGGWSGFVYDYPGGTGMDFYVDEACTKRFRAVKVIKSGETVPLGDIVLLDGQNLTTADYDIYDNIKSIASLGTGLAKASRYFLGKTTSLPILYLKVHMKGTYVVTASNNIEMWGRGQDASHNSSWWFFPTLSFEYGAINLSLDRDASLIGSGYPLVQIQGTGTGNNAYLKLFGWMTIDNRSTSDGDVAIQVNNPYSFLSINDDVTITNSLGKHGIGILLKKDSGMASSPLPGLAVHDQLQMSNFKYAIKQEWGQIRLCAKSVGNYSGTYAKDVIYNFSNCDHGIYLSKGTTLAKAYSSIEEFRGSDTQLKSPVSVTLDNSWQAGDMLFASGYSDTDFTTTVPVKVSSDYSDRELISVKKEDGTATAVTYSAGSNTGVYPALLLADANVYNYTYDKWYNDISQAASDSYTTGGELYLYGNVTETYQIQLSKNIIVKSAPSSSTKDGRTGSDSGFTVQWTALNKKSSTGLAEYNDCFQVNQGVTLTTGGNTIPVTFKSNLGEGVMGRVFHVFGTAAFESGTVITGGNCIVDDMSGGGVMVGNADGTSLGYKSGTPIYGTVTTNHAKITGNTAVNGGGVYIANGTMTCTDTEFTSNTAHATDSYRNATGGGIWVSTMSLCFLKDGCKVSGNQNVPYIESDPIMPGRGVYCQCVLHLEGEQDFSTDNEIRLACTQTEDGGTGKSSVIRKDAAITLKDSTVPIKVSLGDTYSNVFRGRDVLDTASDNAVVVTSSDLALFEVMDLDKINKTKDADLQLVYSLDGGTLGKAVLELQEINHDITVNKSGMTPGETCVFTVLCNSGGTTHRIMLKAGEAGTATAVLKRLDVTGSPEYTVAEDGTWSWTYTQPSAQTHDIVSGSPVFNFVNTKDATKSSLLNAEDSVKNKLSNELINQKE